MRQRISALSSALIALLLLTVLAPGYAWEATAGKGRHGEQSTLIDAHGPGEHDAPKHPSSSGQKDQAPHDLHGCAGHMLGHLAAAIESGNSYLLDATGADAIASRLSALRPQYLDTLDHPPRVGAPA